MRIFLILLTLMIAGTAYWLWSNQGETLPEGATAHIEQTDNQALTTANIDTALSTSATVDGQTDEKPAAVSNRFSGSAAATTNSSGNTESYADLTGDVERAFRESTDLASLYQQLVNPTGPEDVYYRYRILQECRDVRARGIDGQLASCEKIASATAQGLSDTNFVDADTTASAIAERCYAVAERCANLDFESITEQPSDALADAIEQGSVLARAANIYQDSEENPDEAREWLAAVLAEEPSPELIRHTNRYLRSAYRIRGENYLGVNSPETLRSAELALDLVACRFDNGCPSNGIFMQQQCNYLIGCAPWQSYEEWLFQSLSSDQEQLNGVLQLAQDYQLLIQSGNTGQLLFPATEP